MLLKITNNPKYFFNIVFSMYNRMKNTNKIIKFKIKQSNQINNNIKFVKIQSQSYNLYSNVLKLALFLPFSHSFNTDIDFNGTAIAISI